MLLEVQCKQDLEVARIAARRRLVVSAKVILCTIASTNRIVSDMQGAIIHTVVVDEAGATGETAMPLLLRLQPVNMILVGGKSEQIATYHHGPVLG